MRSPSSRRPESRRPNTRRSANAAPFVSSGFRIEFGYQALLRHAPAASLCLAEIAPYRLRNASGALILPDPTYADPLSR
jgi:hypothetical protein